ncbi:D(2) dopamine receptor [Patella vulgata]|uniref:D(2) dopamine receptor n=1 Tax=Patella vulgata TaxID=6465 RepID=UPI002180462F|nr:D(2) dopamine receptor [Patella vulgata]
MMTSQTNSSVEELLRQLSDEKAMVLLPAILYVGILMVVGFLGNGLVCFIFVRKLKPGTQNIMILCLAASDFLVCSIGMPTEITDMRFDYTFESEFACKLLRFVNALSTIWSDFTLVAIAVDRYIKVCRPFGRQMTVRDAKTAVLVSLLIAILLSWPMLFIFGTRSKDTGIPGLFGKDCSTSDAVKGTNYPLIYNSILFVCFVLVTIVFIVLYAKIYRTVKRQKVVMDKARKYNASTEEYATSESVNRLDTSAESGKQNQISPTIFTQTADSLIKNDASMVNSKEDKTVSVDRTHSLTSKVSVDEPTLMKVSSHFTVDLQKSVTSILPPTDMLGVDAERTKQEVKSSKKSRKENKLGPESRTTLIAFLVTIVFVLSYLPYLGMTFSSIFNKGYNHHLRGPSLAAYNLFLRSYFVNSAVNPIIYGLLNPKFSRAVKAMFKGPTCCRPSRIYDLD